MALTYLPNNKFEENMKKYLQEYSVKPCKPCVLIPRYLKSGAKSRDLNKTFTIPSILLSMYSTYFKRYIEDAEEAIKSCGRSTDVITIVLACSNAVTKANLKYIMQFITEGAIKVNQSQLLLVAKAAEKLEIADILDLITPEMMRKVTKDKEEDEENEESCDSESDEPTPAPPVHVPSKAKSVKPKKPERPKSSTPKPTARKTSTKKVVTPPPPPPPAEESSSDTSSSSDEGPIQTASGVTAVSRITGMNATDIINNFSRRRSSSHKSSISEHVTLSPIKRTNSVQEDPVVIAVEERPIETYSSYGRRLNEPDSTSHPAKRAKNNSTDEVKQSTNEVTVAKNMHDAATIQKELTSYLTTKSTSGTIPKPENVNSTSIPFATHTAHVIQSQDFNRSFEDNQHRHSKGGGHHSQRPYDNRGYRENADSNNYNNDYSNGRDRNHRPSNGGGRRGTAGRGTGFVQRGSRGATRGNRQQMFNR